MFYLNRYVQSIVQAVKITITMDWVKLTHAISWLPWYTLSYDYTVIQLALFYVFVSFIYTYNYYSILMLLFFFVTLLSILMGIFQLDLFLGFFILIELTVIFVGVILLFYLNPKGLDFVPNTYAIYYNYWGLSVLILFYLANPYFSMHESYFFNFSYSFVWENFYEANCFLVKNDFISLFYSYYIYNSLTLIFIGFILFIGSLACINLNSKALKSAKNGLPNYLSKFTKFKSFINFSFLRKQDLSAQMHANIAIKIVAKKNGAKKLNTNPRK